MILTIADWKLDIDLEATMEYSASEAREHCTCAYCRNFYASVDGTYPQLRPFLAQFGLDIEAPDELMPFDDGTNIIYDAVYTVCGTIVQQGSEMIILDIPVHFENGAMVNTEIPEPCVSVSIGLFSIPWVLDEPLKEVVSPANEPSFLKKMWSKLLGRAGDTPKS